MPTPNQSTVPNQADQHPTSAVASYTQRGHPANWYRRHVRVSFDRIRRSARYSGSWGNGSYIPSPGRYTRIIHSGHRGSHSTLAQRSTRERHVCTFFDSEASRDSPSHVILSREVIVHAPVKKRQWSVPQTMAKSHRTHGAFVYTMLRYSWRCPPASQSHARVGEMLTLKVPRISPRTQAFPPSAKMALATRVTPWPSKDNLRAEAPMYS